MKEDWFGELLDELEDAVEAGSEFPKPPPVKLTTSVAAAKSARVFEAVAKGAIPALGSGPETVWHPIPSAPGTSYHPIIASASPSPVSWGLPAPSGAKVKMQKQITAFQRRVGLRETGEIDLATWGRLRRDLMTSATPEPRAASRFTPPENPDLGLQSILNTVKKASDEDVFRVAGEWITKVTNGITEITRSRLDD